MDRVPIPIGPLAQILDRLPDLTLRDIEQLKPEVARHEGLLRSRLDSCRDRAADARRQELLTRHYAKGGEPLRVVGTDDESRDWAAPHEEEAVLQGQDGPDPVYAVAPRPGVNFGGSTRLSGPGISYEVPTAEDPPLEAFAVAPRFGGVECRAVPADPFEGFPDLPLGADALAPAARRIGGEQWEPEDVGPGLTEADHCPLTGCMPAGEESLDPDAPIPFDLADDDQDDDDTPLVVPPFTDEQEGE